MEVACEKFDGTKSDNPNMFTVFQQNKINFLNEIYSKKTTQESYWSIFKNYFNEIEEDKNKDIYELSKIEIEELMHSLPTTSLRAIKTIWSLLNNYMKWAINREYRNSTNPFEEMNIEEFTQISKKVAKKKYHSLDDVYAQCEYLVNTLDFSVQEVMPIILSRYGIVGKQLSWMVSLKSSHIDREKKIVNIYENEKLITILPVDDRFITWIEKSIECRELVVEIKSTEKPIVKKFQYLYNGYILKSTRNTEKVNKQSIYTTMNKIFSSLSKKRVSFTEYLNSRKFDLLFGLKNENGYITYDDIRCVTKKFNPFVTDTAYISLKEDYVSLGGKNDIISMK